MKIFKNILALLMIFLVLGGTVFAQEVESSDKNENSGEEVSNEEVESAMPTNEIISAKAKIVKIDKAYKEMEGTEYTQSGPVSGTYEEQYLKIEILSGEDEGEMITITNNVYGNPFDIKVDEGDKVLLYGESSKDGIEYSLRDRWHSDGLIFWSFVFFAMVVVVGGKAGLKALISLIGSIVMIFFVFMPLVKDGYPPVPLTVAIAGVIILVTHLIITGVGKKSWAAMIGTLGGVITAAGMAYVIAWAAGISGLGTEQARTLAIEYHDYDFRGLLFSGIILGALGAVMDVGISIASGLSEVKEHSPNISRAKLIKSGFNIGRDIMGSMINTLVFAYIGSSLVAIVLFSILQTGFFELVNYDFIAEEITRSLVGSLGLLATIPLTAVLSGFLMAEK